MTESSRYPRSGHSNVVARLHALFPGPPGGSPRHPQNQHPPPLASTTPRSFLKVRILTWNMHETLPKGDLTELLGSLIEQASTSVQPQDASGLPLLPADARHPYHLVVVAGQECPTASGLPMGLGAGFKLKDLVDKDRVKDKRLQEHDQKEGDSEHGSIRHALTADYAVSAATESEEHIEHPPSKERSTDLSHHKSLQHASPWSLTLDSWYGSKTLPHRSTKSLPDVSDPLLFPKSEILGTSDAKSINLAGESTGLRGVAAPYELLIKERMMGLYLAIYVNVNIKHLVRGTSKNAVTTGLIGGRVGNKGGVGISLNIAGTTLLFINAHLAAHEAKWQHRLADFAKIKAELDVDNYLLPDDPRIMSEDIIDKFDHTFLCGDLNFRLNISRLHADWLISQKDYERALGFDQLRQIMDSRRAFVGFKEAPITFPPTFKYDVMRTMRRLRSTSKAPASPFVPQTPGHQKSLTDVTEKDGEVQGRATPDGGGTHEQQADKDQDAASMVSSTFTSARSRYSQGEDAQDMEGEDLIYSPEARAKGTKALHRFSFSTIKAKWVAMVTPVKVEFIKHKPLKRKKRPRAKSTRSSLASEAQGRRSQSVPMTDDCASSTNLWDEAQEQEAPEEGKYDSSHKQRVPSWCDRILWKSTIEPEEAAIPPLQPTRSRVASFFQVLRPVRSRRDSSSSMLSAVLEPINASTTKIPSPLSPVHAREQRWPNRPQPHRVSRMSRPKSIDALPTLKTQKLQSNSVPVPPRRLSLEGAVQSVPLIQSQTMPPTADWVPNIPSSERSPALTVTSALAAGPSPSGSASRWFGFLPAFMNREGPGSTGLESPAEEPSLPLPPRGTVVCLDYRTLDDTAMRRLEGRSDHRPVIGSYAIYV